MSKKLAVAILHYHLRPGGVTRVVERAVESIGNEVDLLVLTGEAPAPDDALTPITEPFYALEYSEGAKLSNFERVAEDLRFTARSLLGRDPDVWHIHNHSLGKNSFTPQFVWHLANAGCRVLLQPHDFAEDGRPENYRLLKEQIGVELDGILYPNADHVWYAPINYRDKAFLEGIGLTHVHELPNAVTAQIRTAGTPPASAQKTIVYPARAIRRKNIGEFLLWSLLAPEGYLFQSTLAPQNPKWQGVYNEWVAFAEEFNLPVEFDAGHTNDFSGLVQNAEALISTSIAEGFGLAFLEPWLEGKMLIGRKLPEITPDFEEEGLDLSTLYAALPIPLEWAGEAQFYLSLETAMKQSYVAYSKEWKNEYFEDAKSTLVVDGQVDFGILDEALQRNVIRHLAENLKDRKTLPPFHPSTTSSLIELNRQVALDHYSLEAYGKRLLGLYRDLAATEPGEVTAANAADLLDEFLQPARFNLLRT
ncbi:glycosyltransferase family 4 protein [Pontiella sulfatireligans]|uniref:Mannosylglucosyl-3-phosphoglycerate synthase n=1 Tax=Pontiella sulfatireligans TaxID=2750658 RepID=A0A6C2UJQ0_9BACT|nr:glycosyltransferase family 4 protein [Pontiella sulfatireligans]VGO19426.1 Mannosylglucosyl-3-phosphoglycerate synthase [Pontiella sulfatireligans]